MAVSKAPTPPVPPKPRPGNGNKSSSPVPGNSGPTPVSTTPSPNDEKALQIFWSAVDGYGIPGADLNPLAQAFMNWRKNNGESGDVQSFLYTARTQVGSYANDAYTKLFPNIDTMRAKGGMVDQNGNPTTVNEANYMRMYQAYRQATKSLPGYDQTPEQMSQFMLNDVSPLEVSRRVTAAKEFAQTSSEASALKQLYGVDTDTIAAYLLDPVKGKDLIDRNIQAVRVGAAAQQSGGFSLDPNDPNALSKTDIEKYAADTSVADMTPDQLRKYFTTIGDTARMDARLGAIDNEQVAKTDALDSILLDDRKKKLASQARAQREAARFGGSSGFSGDSLGGSGI